MSENSSTWEFSKENIQPLSVGRKMQSLTDSLQAEAHSSSVPDQFETYRALFANCKNAGGEDPVVPFVEMISYMEQHRLTSGTYAEVLSKVEKRAVRKCVGMERYQNDIRFITIYLRRLRHYPLESRIDMLEGAIQTGLGKKLSQMYLALCDDLESKLMFRHASELLHTGIRNDAQPKELLEEALKNLEVRVANHVARDMTTEKDVDSSHRSFGHGMSVSGKNEAPSIRQDLPPAPATTSYVPTQVPSKKIDIFSDSNIGCDKKVKPIDVNRELAALDPDPETENFMKPSKWNLHGLNSPDRKECVEKIPIFQDEESYDIPLSKGRGRRRSSSCKPPGLRQVTRTEDELSAKMHEEFEDLVSRSSVSVLKDQMKDLRLGDTTSRDFPCSSSFLSQEERPCSDQIPYDPLPYRPLLDASGKLVLDEQGAIVLTPTRRFFHLTTIKHDMDEPQSVPEDNDAEDNDAGENDVCQSDLPSDDQGEKADQDVHYSVLRSVLEEFQSQQFSYEEILTRLRYPNRLRVHNAMKQERLFSEDQVRFEEQRSNKQSGELFTVHSEDLYVSLKASAEALGSEEPTASSDPPAPATILTSSTLHVDGRLPVEVEVVPTSANEEHIQVQADSASKSETINVQPSPESETKPTTPRKSHVQQECGGPLKACTTPREKMLLGVGIPALVKRLEELEKEVRTLQDKNSKLERQACRQSDIEEYMLQLESRISQMERNVDAPRSPRPPAAQDFKAQVTSENINPKTVPAPSVAIFQDIPCPVQPSSPRDRLQKQIDEVMSNETTAASSPKRTTRRPSLGALTDLHFYRPPIVNPYEDYTEAIFKQPFEQEIEFNTSNITRALALQPRPTESSTPERERPGSLQSFYGPGPEYVTEHHGMYYSAGPSGSSSDRRSQFNQSLHEAAHNLSTIQETSKESRGSTTGSSSSTNMQTTRGVSGYNMSASGIYSHNFPRWTSITTPNPSRYYNSSNNY